MRCFALCSRSLPLLLLTSLLAILPIEPLNTCWVGSHELQIQHYTFPGLVRAAPDASYLFLNFQEMYRRFGGESHFRDLTNAEEWRERYCNVPRLEDIETILYKSTLGELEYLRTAVISKSIPLSQALSRNSFARYLEKNGCRETAVYLVYAKRCEPQVTVGENPWKPKKRNLELMNALIGEAVSLFPKIESHYIRLRYLFQMVRLAHYSGQYQRVLDLYDAFMPQIDHNPSIIEYWILGHKAGALRAMGEYASSTYLYSRIFAECAGKRESAYLSYRIRTDQEWRQSLLLAQNSKEQIALIAMRGFGKKARVAAEMKAIYAIDPKNYFLELLLEREIRNLEPLLERAMPKKQYSKKYIESLGDRAVILLQLVRFWGEEGKVKRPALWQMAQGYLEVLTGDYYSASRTFSRVRPKIKDRQLRDQLEAWALVFTITNWTKPTSKVELQADSIQNYHDQYLAHEGPFRDLLFGKMASMYEQDGQLAKAFLCRYTLKDLFGNPRLPVVEDMLQLGNKTSFNTWERDLTSISGIPSFQSEMVVLQAMNQFGTYELERALRTLNQINPAEWDLYGGKYDLLRHQLNDCVNCEVRDTSRRQYNKGEVIQELLDLEYEAKANPEKAAPNYFLMGLAYYNLTYFGPAWNVLDRFRSGASIKQRRPIAGNIYYHPEFAIGNREHMDCSQALYYFDRARQLSTSNELAARATFWAAKCEQNAYFANKWNGASRTYDYFTLLRDNYSDTEFYVRAIRECKYFSAFVAK